ncbi:MAG: SusC/RagA family TonB-linked outer membrane protein [Bacteroidales bacterium]
MEKQKKKKLFQLPEKLTNYRLFPLALKLILILIYINASAGPYPELLSNNEVSQDMTITGTVTDEAGESLPGVSVTVQGTTVGTVTDADGNYSITVPAMSEVLSFTYVGMTPQNIMIEDRTTIDVIMHEDRIGLDEVIVVGYGTQSRANVIGSVTAVRSDDLTAAPVSRVSNALAGRLPGGIFLQESGEPGRDEALIRVRGQSTFNNNNPLIVIDGIPGRDMNSLNPADIESVTVLKDASAAIYGARAANGVILITTKRGQTEAPPSFTYNFYEGFLSPTMLPEMTDAPTYATMIREMESYRNVEEENMQYSLEDIEKYRSGEYWWTHPDTDWFSEALKDYSSTRNHNLSVTGGTQKLRYFSSFGTQTDDGIFTNGSHNYNRYNLRANLDVAVNDFISVALDITGIQENRMYPTRSANETFNTTIRIWPTSHAVWPNGLPGPDRERGDQPMVSASDATGFDDDKRYRSNNLLSANINIPGVEGLKLSGYFAYDMYIQQRKLFETPWEVWSLNTDAYFAAGNTGREDGTAFLVPTQVRHPEPRLTNYSDNSNTQTVNMQIDYARAFNGHSIDAFIAYEQNEYYGEGFNAYRRYFISDQLPYLFAGGDEEKNNWADVELDASQNYFGRLSYNYEQTYLLQFSLRRDGSLRFSKDAGRWGTFPSLLIGWRPSEEDWWINNIGFIEYFKLRASYGQLGNDLVDAFQYLTMYGFQTGYNFGEGKTYQSAIDQSNVPNPFITWERATVYNFGWESHYMDSRLSWETDFFYERRTDILVERDVSVPRFTGISLPDENFGIIDNRGFETTVEFRDRAGDIAYQLSGNFAFARNEVIEADEPERSVPWQQRTGNPMGARLLYISDGIFRDMEHVNSLPHVSGARPGDIIIRDYDNDGEITTDDRVLFTETAIPEMTFGLTFNLSYKGWALNGLLQGQSGTMREMRTGQQGSAGNYFQYDAEDRWTPDNPDGSMPRAFERVEEYWRGSHQTDHYWVDNTFVRLRNLNLSYTIPQNLSNVVGASDARIYVAGQNLWLLYSGNPYVDPEVHGVNAYPIMRVMSLGAQISF